MKNNDNDSNGGQDTKPRMHAMNFRFPEQILQALDRAAQSGMRSRTAQALHYIRAGLVADGLLTVDPSRDDRPRRPEPSGSRGDR